MRQKSILNLQSVLKGATDDIFHVLCVLAWRVVGGCEGSSRRGNPATTAATPQLQTPTLPSFKSCVFVLIYQQCYSTEMPSKTREGEGDYIILSK